MSMESVKKNPWPLRILIASMVCFVIGSVLILGQTSMIGDALDPARNNVVSIDAGSEAESPAFTIDDAGCHRAYGVDFEGNVTLIELDGSNEKGLVKESKCKLDWGAMSADGSVEYTILGSWELAEGDYRLRWECEGTCTNETVWLTSIDRMESELLSSPYAIIGGIVCCLGILLLPLSGVLLAFAQNRKQGVMMVVGPDGQLMPLTDLTPDVVQNQIKAMNEGTREEVGFDIRTGEYMKPESNMNAQQQDGAQDVQAGNMLTTEQVYALMRGDVESASPQEQEAQVADPFPTPPIQRTEVPSRVDVKPKAQPERKIPVAKNEDWQSWDED